MITLRNTTIEIPLAAISGSATPRKESSQLPSTPAGEHLALNQRFHIYLITAWLIAHFFLVVALYACLGPLLSQTQN